MLPAAGPGSDAHRQRLRREYGSRRLAGLRDEARRLHETFTNPDSELPGRPKAGL